MPAPTPGAWLAAEVVPGAQTAEGVLDALRPVAAEVGLRRVAEVDSAFVVVALQRTR